MFLSPIPPQLVRLSFPGKICNPSILKHLLTFYWKLVQSFRYWAKLRRGCFWFPYSWSILYKQKLSLNSRSSNVIDMKLGSVTKMKMVCYISINSKRLPYRNCKQYERVSNTALILLLWVKALLLPFKIIRDFWY